MPELPYSAPREDRYGFIDWRQLPHPEWDQYWDRIYLPAETKRRLYNYARFTLTQRKSFSVVGMPIHGIALLRGVPGTGKSSIVRGLAQKLATEQFPEGVLFAEVKAHALPSQMLGDSQRNTANLLERALPELAEKGLPVVVLIDEVDAIATDRDRASAGTDPVDVARATEAALQGLDRLAAMAPNIVMLATSNFPQAIDPAFLSRLDLSFNVDVPDAQTTAAILADALAEVGTDIDEAGQREAASELAGLSGRDVRKIVFEAIVSRDIDVAVNAPLNAEDLLNAIQSRRATTSLTSPIEADSK
ncbi:MAG: SpoVK/Ycf46/Vps4 family AAA+-type ATPase [Verrucomicrobiales bacterium]